MPTYHGRIRLTTRGDCHIVDITEEVTSHLSKSHVNSGLCNVFCSGSTGAVTTMEYEDGLLADFPDAMERFAPAAAEYEHHLRWGDGNGHSHVRASVIGPSLTVPIVDAKMTLGTWQQIVFIDFDNRPRSREIEVMIVGE